MNAMPFARCLPMSQTARAGCGRLDAHEHHVKAKKSGNQNQKRHGRVVRSVLTVSADVAGQPRVMTPALAAPNPSDSFERERSGHVLPWSRIAPVREELRNASNKSEHEPTSNRSTNYGNGHLIRVFRDIGRIFSSLLLYLGASDTRHLFVTFCRGIVQS